jgi:hypothetical protein
VDVALSDWSPSPKVMATGDENVVLFLVATGFAVRLATELVPTELVARNCTV